MLQALRCHPPHRGAATSRARGTPASPPQPLARMGDRVPATLQAFASAPAAWLAQRQVRKRRRRLNARERHSAAWIGILHIAMQIERRRAGNRSTRGAQCGNGGDASSTGGAIAVFGVQRNPNPRRTNEAESLRPLLRHHNTFATTNQIGIKEAPARNQPRMRDRRITDASQCSNKFRTKTRACRVRPTPSPLRRGA